MVTHALWWAVLCACAGHVTTLAPAEPMALRPDRTVLVVLGGFRGDFLTRYETSFQATLGRSTHAEYLKPVFPTVTYPNIHSLMTGLYPESHHVTGDYMYDVERDIHFMKGSSTPEGSDHWWQDAEPFWITLEKKGMRTWMQGWPGCDVTMQGVRSTHCTPPRNDQSMEELNHLVLEAVIQLTNNQSDFAAVYFSPMLTVGKLYGPDSVEMERVVQQVAESLEYITASVLTQKFASSINLIVTSDHGMIATSHEHHVNLDQHRVWDQVQNKHYNGATLSLYPNDKIIDEVHRLLTVEEPVANMDVYMRQDIPEAWRYSRGQWAPPLLAVLHEGWGFADPHNMEAGNTAGTHGYDNNLEGMRGVFLATGPSFKANYTTAEHLETVDIYQILCSLEGFDPLPHNGSWERVKDILTERHWTGPVEEFSYSRIFLPIYFVILFGVLFFMGLIVTRSFGGGTPTDTAYRMKKSA